jgi:hypothetical protein
MEQCAFAEAGTALLRCWRPSRSPRCSKGPSPHVSFHFFFAWSVTYSCALLAPTIASRLRCLTALSAAISCLNSHSRLLNGFKFLQACRNFPEACIQYASHTFGCRPRRTQECPGSCRRNTMDDSMVNYDLLVDRIGENHVGDAI